MKKIMLTLGAAASTAASFAADVAPVTYGGSVAEDIVQNASDTLTNFLEGAGPVIAGIVVAGLAVWGGIALVGIVKKAFSAGKGR